MIHILIVDLLVTCKTEEPKVAPIEEPKVAPMKEPEYCRWKQAFNGTCSERGSPRTICFFDFLVHEVQEKGLRTAIVLLSVFVNVQLFAINNTY